jgi:hypothetical protein
MAVGSQASGRTHPIHGRRQTLRPTCSRKPRSRPDAARSRFIGVYRGVAADPAGTTRRGRERLPPGAILHYHHFSPSPPPREERGGVRRSIVSKFKSPLPGPRKAPPRGWPLPAQAGRGSWWWCQVAPASAFTAGFDATSAFDDGRIGESKLSLIVSGQYASIYASSTVCVSRLFPMNSV